MKKVIIKRNAIITAYNFFPSNKVFIHIPHGVVNECKLSSLKAGKTVTISDFMSPVPHCHKGGDRIQPFILFFIDEAEVLSGFPPTRE
jgi:hypothetical protein